MSIAEKVLQLKQDFDNVFTAGKAAGGSGDYEQGYEDGKQAEYDTFWDNFQEYGNRRSYRNAFQDYGMNWKNGTTYNPKYHITVSSSGYGSNNVFANATGITDTLVDFICEGSLGLNSTFNAARNLKTIKKIVVNEGVTYSSTFANCTALENITFEGVIAGSLSFANSSLLTNDSVQSIIDHLKDLTGGTVQTLTLHASIGAKLTDEQKATITAKNWTLVY